MHINYRSYIENELRLRQVRNPSYSLRAFARDLDLPAPKLSNLLNGRGGISPAKANQIAQVMRLDPLEMKIFVLSVSANHSRSEAARKLAQLELEMYLQKIHWQDFHEEQFKIISEWYFFAILELMETKDFRSENRYIAKKLNLDESLVKKALKHLEELDLIKKTKSGSWAQTYKDLSVASNQPSQSIRKYHKQILNKADMALDEYPIDQRDFSSVTVAMNKKKYLDVVNKIKKFRRELVNEIVKDPSPKDCVYNLSIQFFPFDKDID
jgi:uncharacterized protein (TIGR02147 family)